MGWFGETDAERRRRWDLESEHYARQQTRNLEWEAEQLKRMQAAFACLTEVERETIMFHVCQQEHSENTNSTRKSSIYSDCERIATDLIELRKVQGKDSGKEQSSG